MRVRKTLQISVGLVTVSALAVLLMIFLALHKVSRAMEGTMIAGDIISAIFERTVFRNDYLQSNSDRARQQWFAMHGQITRTLALADQKDWNREDRLLVDQIRKDNDTTVKLFSAIVAGREKGTAPLAEMENRLLTQLVMKTYDTVLHARKLQESSRNNLLTVINLAALSLVPVLTVMIVAVILGSFYITRLVSERVMRLREGAAAVGNGDFSHRIGLEGDDEFVEISDALDDMTSRLHQSYLDLESEIVERRRVEAALRESEDRFRGTFENAAVGIALLDPEGRFIQANGKLCGILGYREEELKGCTFSGLTYPDDIEPDRGRYVQLMKGELDSYEVEKQYVRKEGSTVWVRVTRSARLGERDRTVYSISVVQEITARKQAEERLHRSNLLLRAVTESTPDPIFLKDRQGRMLMANTATLGYLRKSFEEVLGRTDEEYLGGEAGARIRENDRQVMMRGETIVFEEIMETEGDRRVYLSTKSPYRDAMGNIIGIIGVSRDITERIHIQEELRQAKDELERRVQERTEELSRVVEELRCETEERIHAVEELRKKEQLLMQQNRLAAMGEMLVNISHQWRQPLNVLGLILQELNRSYQRGELTGEFLEAKACRAREVISHMSQTIDDFRNFLSPDKISGVFNVKEVVETTLSMVQESLSEMQVVVRVKAEDAVVVKGFRNEYAQAVMNILINARDVYRERNIAAPQLDISIFRHNGRSVVTFTDNAGGISGDVMGRIFEPYFTTKAPDGTGIGLFMSKMIIEWNMHGTLSVRNTDGGAEFRIEV